MHVPLTAFWFVGYFAFFATSLWLKARRRPRYWPPVRAYGIGAALLGLVTLAVQPSLIVGPTVHPASAWFVGSGRAT